MTVEELPGYLKEHWPDDPGAAADGTYQPQPVKRVEIPKPDGGMRKLGIPTVLDRFIQQAVLQVLQAAMGPDVLRAQLRLPPGPLGPSGGGPGAGVHRRRLRGGSWTSTWRNSSTGSTTTC